MNRKKILIVEDELITATDIKFQLEDWEYEVVGIALTGNDAIKLAKKENPDLILMDITLKGKMSGIEATKIISKENINVIFLTAHSDKNTFHKIQKTKALGIIIKPFDEKRLHESIKAGLSETVLSYPKSSIENTIYNKFNIAKE